MSKPLTRRELQVCELLARGYNNKQVGQQLGISHRTVEDHRHNMFEKYEVRNFTALLWKVLREKQHLPCPICGRAEVAQ